jgi:hypothetical protein
MIYLSPDVKDVAIALCTRCPSIISLTLKQNPQLTVDCLTQIADCCPFIGKLDLWGLQHMGDNELLEIALLYPNLESLALNCCPITDKGLHVIAEHCKRMSALFLYTYTAD